MKLSHIEKTLNDKDSSLASLREIKDFLLSKKNKVLRDIEDAKEERKRSALTDNATEAHKQISSDINGLMELIAAYDDHLRAVEDKMAKRKALINSDEYKTAWDESKRFLQERDDCLEKAEGLILEAAALLAKACECGSSAVRVAPASNRSLESLDLLTGKEILNAYVQLCASFSGAATINPELRNIWPFINRPGKAKLFEIFARDKHALLRHIEVDGE